jgi:transposase
MEKKAREQRKDWAKLLYTKEHLSQKEIAERTGVSAVTINKWAKEGEWQKLRQSMLTTKETQIARLYEQLDELNSVIQSRDPGERYANSKEADTLTKLTAAIKSMETDASIADITEVGKRLLEWLRPQNPDKAIEVARLFDDFIKDCLKR